MPTQTTQPTQNAHTSSTSSRAAVNFRASKIPKSFITKNRPLPTPAEVREQAKKEGCTAKGKPDVVIFRSLGLVVKYGPHITVAEGQCMWGLKKFLKGAVPVPEVYKWCRDGNEVFVYMELVEGGTLEELWPSLSSAERWEISKQLRLILESLASLEQEQEPKIIGGPSGEPLQDYIFQCLQPPGTTKGPFSSVKEFHDWYSYLPCLHHNIEGSKYINPYRHDLPDDVPIVFTHNDLHPSNIMISCRPGAGIKISAIIDWHQSGWYPAYWEGCKLRWSSPQDGEWVNTYLPEVREDPICYEAWMYYLDAMGVI